MSVENFYDGGSVEIHPRSHVSSITQEMGVEGGAPEYVYVKYRNANKRLAAIESQILEHEVTIDKYAAALQNETQLREVYHKALCEEQAEHSVCRADYLRLLKSSNVHHACDEQVPKVYKAQLSQLLVLEAYLQQKIRTMTAQQSSALCVAADRIARTETALDRMQMQNSETMYPFINPEKDA